MEQKVLFHSSSLRALVVEAQSGSNRSPSIRKPGTGTLPLERLTRGSGTGGERGVPPPATSPHVLFCQFAASPQQPLHWAPLHRPYPGQSFRTFPKPDKSRLFK